MKMRYVITGMDSAKPRIAPVAGASAGHPSFDAAVRAILAHQHRKKEQAERALMWARDLARVHHGQAAATCIT